MCGGRWTLLGLCEPPLSCTPLHSLLESYNHQSLCPERQTPSYNYKAINHYALKDKHHLTTTRQSITMSWKTNTILQLQGNQSLSWKTNTILQLQGHQLLYPDRQTSYDYKAINHYILKEKHHLMTTRPSIFISWKTNTILRLQGHQSLYPKRQTTSYNYKAINHYILKDKQHLTTTNHKESSMQPDHLSNIAYFSISFVAIMMFNATEEIFGDLKYPAPYLKLLPIHCFHLYPPWGYCTGSRAHMFK